MTSITVGLLLPSSTIFPISKDFERGIKDAIKQYSSPSIEIEIVKEFIGQGDVKTVQNACNKFFNYDNVDLVTGFVSFKVVSEVASSFQTKKIPFIVNDLGGHIPAVDDLNEYILINSAHLWRHAWTIGNYAVKKFGKKGMFIGALYDAGYSFSHMFYEGMQAADKESEWFFSVPPMPAPGELSNIDVVFPFLEEYQPDFVFSTFCGTETTLFLNKFIEKGWHKRTRLLGLPYLLSPFEQLPDDVTIHTTEIDVVNPEKAFYELGLSTGKTIAIAVAAQQAASGKTLLQELQQANLFSVNNIAKPLASQPETIRIAEKQIIANTSSIRTEKTDTWATIELDSEAIRPFTQGLSATWNNPYLCI